MKFTELKIPGVVSKELFPIRDERGYFSFESVSYNVGSGESTLVGDIANFISGQFGYELVTILQEDEHGDPPLIFW